MFELSHFGHEIMFFFGYGIASLCAQHWWLSWNKSAGMSLRAGGADRSNKALSLSLFLPPPFLCGRARLYTLMSLCSIVPSPTHQALPEFNHVTVLREVDLLLLLLPPSLLPPPPAASRAEGNAQSLSHPPLVDPV